MLPPPYPGDAPILIAAFLLLILGSLLYLRRPIIPRIVKMLYRVSLFFWAAAKAVEAARAQYRAEIQECELPGE